MGPGFQDRLLGGGVSLKKENLQGECFRYCVSASVLKATSLISNAPLTGIDFNLKQRCFRLA
jgi:hypothetical protein